MSRSSSYKSHQSEGYEEVKRIGYKRSDHKSDETFVFRRSHTNNGYSVITDLIKLNIIKEVPLYEQKVNIDLKNKKSLVDKIIFYISKFYRPKNNDVKYTLVHITDSTNTYLPNYLGDVIYEKTNLLEFMKNKNISIDDLNNHKSISRYVDNDTKYNDSGELTINGKNMNKPKKNFTRKVADMLIKKNNQPPI